MPETASEAPGDEANRSVNPPPPGGSPISGIMFGLLLLVVIFGFLSLRSSHTDHGFWSGAYHSIGLLYHDSGWAFDNHDDKSSTNSFWFRVLAVIGPLLTALTFAYVFTNWLPATLVRQWTFVRLASGSGRGIALVGLNTNSLALARVLKSKSDAKGKPFIPVIFTEDRTSALAMRCRRHRIPTCSRHARGLLCRCQQEGAAGRRWRLYGPVIDRTQYLISFLSDPDAQIDMVIEVGRWRPRGGHEAARAIVLMDDRGLARRLDEQFNSVRRGEVVPRLATLATLAARQLLQSHQFDVLADAFGQKQIHLVIYGLGAVGRAVVKEAAQLYVTWPSVKPTAKLQITAFDQLGDAARDALLAEDPGLENVVDLNVESMLIPPAGLLQAQVSRLPPHATGHIIAFDEASRSVNLAISLRRWLLEPPAGLDEVWAWNHQAAPIFVRIRSWQGLGRLFDTPLGQARSRRLLHKEPKSATPDPVMRYWPPNGIYDFGAVEALFGSLDHQPSHHGAVLDDDSERGAEALHDGYVKKRSTSGVAGTPEEQRIGEADWHELSPQLRESNFRAYDHIGIKTRAAGCRLVPGTEPASPDISPLNAKADILAQLEHRRYMAERLANGWRRGDSRLDAVGVHPDLKPWEDLDGSEKALDSGQINRLPVVAAAAGHRIAKALVIGVIGHRAGRLGDTAVERDNKAKIVKQLLSAQLYEVLRNDSGSAPLLLTALASGTDSWAAESALDRINPIPFLAVLPLPYEILREDFPEKADLDTFKRLAAAAELRIELPLKFGRASQMTRNPQQPPTPDALARRAQQYKVAGAYIVERADVLIVVSDGGPDEAGGCTSIVREWWTEGVPSEYQTAECFFPRPLQRSPAIIIDPVSETVSHDPKPVSGPARP